MEVRKHKTSKSKHNKSRRAKEDLEHTMSKTEQATKSHDKEITEAPKKTPLSKQDTIPQNSVAQNSVRDGSSNEVSMRNRTVDNEISERERVSRLESARQSPSLSVKKSKPAMGSIYESKSGKPTRKSKVGISTVGAN